jgi:cystathionine beta-lyase/cystathionine gamma-synthase
MVRRVCHPGLDPETALRAGPLTSFGGVFAFELSSEGLADRLVDELRLIMHAPSLGGLETLICSPRRTSHRALTDDEGNELGIPRSMLRVSVGLEAVDDLWADLQRALDRAATAQPSRNG